MPNKLTNMKARQAKVKVSGNSARLTAALTNTNVARAILLAANLIKRSGNFTYREELGLSAIEWSMIARLGEGGPMTQTQLAEMSLFDKGQLSRAATAMAKRGLIVRGNDSWRSIELRLAPKGRKVLAQIQHISQQRRKLLCAGIDPPALQQFMATLQRIEANANAMLVDSKESDQA
jgi:DNA-binding MarR family transcriptional regulator